MGTYDGANVEIHSQVGDENIFIFGMNAQEAGIMKANGYSPEGYYTNHPLINSVVNKMNNGVNGAKFNELAQTLQRDDRYMCFADFDSYRNAQIKAGETYKDLYAWNKMSLANIAGAGIFSADRAVRDYAATIWNLI
jgi:starch phosphorylase